MGVARSRPLVRWLDCCLLELIGIEVVLQAALWSGSLLSQVLGDIMLEIQSLLYYGVVLAPSPCPGARCGLNLPVIGSKEWND